MFSEVSHIDDLKKIRLDVIPTLGPAAVPSPLELPGKQYIDEQDRILFHSGAQELKAFLDHPPLPGFEEAGPRAKLYFKPSDITCGIVTCGGLCPGLNNVIRSVTRALLLDYGVGKVLGFRYGFEGISPRAKLPPMELNADNVDDIHGEGGTILGTSRGPQAVADMIKALTAHKISILFAVGGDGTFNGAHELAQEILRQRLPIAVIGIPKTIDNDICLTTMSFGFQTAVEEASQAIIAAHLEAKSAWNGVGLVKLMGRDSGFIAVGASLATSEVNFCFIPEVPFTLDGDNGFLARLEKRMARKQHAVIVVSEGAGQDLLAAESPTVVDASGNRRYADIGIYLRDRITDHFQKKNTALALKYIDPSYTIRSRPANASDAIFCELLGQYAVHAGMAGKTDMFVAAWHQRFTHVPLAPVVGRRKHVDPNGVMWQSLLTTLT